jgi:hypothetical protein
MTIYFEIKNGKTTRKIQLMTSRGKKLGRPLSQLTHGGRAYSPSYMESIGRRITV